jgi:hypothetical protein
MVSVVAVVPPINRATVRAPPVLPSARLGRGRYKARQHCEGSERYGKTLDIESHGSSCLLIRRTMIAPTGKTSETDESSVDGGKADIIVQAAISDSRPW